MAGDPVVRSRVVLDTTTLLRSIPTKSALQPIIRAFDEGRYVLVVSNEILLEYEEILKKLGGPTAWLRMRDLLDGHIDDVVKVDPSFFWNAIKLDPDDDKFVDAAVAGEAEWIVTDDSHFNDLYFDTRIFVRPIHPLMFIERYCSA
jgi:putative PIN family toxin of toxin-antitoxin system